MNKEGESIPDLTDVTGSDTSSVGKLHFSPSISIENTVYMGSDDGAQCGSSIAVELVSGKVRLSIADSESRSRHFSAW